MSRHYYFVVVVELLLFLLACRPRGSVSAEVASLPQKTVLFEPGITKVPLRKGDENLTKFVRYYYSPFFVAVDDFMVYFVEADYTGRVDGSVDIVAKYIESKSTGWADRVIESNETRWRTQLVMQNEVDDLYIFSNPVAVGKGDKVYLLSVKEKEMGMSSKYGNWSFEMAVGDVVTVQRMGKSDKKIKWRILESLGTILTQEFKNQSVEPLPNGRYDGFLTEDGTVVFVLGAVKALTRVTALVQLNITGGEPNLSLSLIKTAANGCYFPRIFPWEKKLIMLFTYCVGVVGPVVESADFGKTWKNAAEPIASTWNKFHDEEGFITATIENKTVLIFIRQRSAKSNPEELSEVYLLFSDGNRVYNVGPFIYNENLVISNKLLYTNGELFSLHQEWDDWFSSVFVVYHKQELARIKATLKIWAKNDKYFLQPCQATNTRDNSTHNVCTTPMPIGGLIGFLSGGGNDTNWRDEYLYMDATVNGGARVTDGFMFSGPGSGAQWPVGTEGPGSWYNFSRSGLTVVATVTIHSVPETNAQLLTFGNGALGGGRPGLWYSRDKRWEVILKDFRVRGGNWETNTSYRVALVLRNNNFDAYVDGGHIGSTFKRSPMRNEFGVRHIFIGTYDQGDKNGGNATTVSHVTVTNVFLYSRPLSDGEIGSLGK